MCNCVRRANHLLAAFDHQSGYVLSQTQVAAETNEAKTALTLLKHLVLEGRVVVGEDRSRVRSQSTPEVLAGVRNLVINWLRSRKIDNLAAALRKNGRNPQLLFAMLGKQNQ